MLIAIKKQLLQSSKDILDFGILYPDQGAEIIEFDRKPRNVTFYDLNGRFPLCFTNPVRFLNISKVVWISKQDDFQVFFEGCLDNNGSALVRTRWVNNKFTIFIKGV